jgi:hypothetical protein
VPAPEKTTRLQQEKECAQMIAPAQLAAGNNADRTVW